MTIPYGISTDVRTTPRPKIARYMTRAMIIPSASSIATEITITNVVLKKSCHHRLEPRTAP